MGYFKSLKNRLSGRLFQRNLENAALRRPPGVRPHQRQRLVVRRRAPVGDFPGGGQRGAEAPGKRAGGTPVRPLHPQPAPDSRGRRVPPACPRLVAQPGGGAPVAAGRQGPDRRGTAAFRALRLRPQPAAAMARRVPGALSATEPAPAARRPGDRSLPATGGRGDPLRRTGRLSLVALPLAPDNRRVLCAAPGYLAERGEPRQPDDLREHNCLLYQLGGRVHDRWAFQRAAAA